MTGKPRRHSVPSDGSDGRPKQVGHDCPLEETLRAVNDLYNEGLFQRFGVSNFPGFTL